MKRLRDLLSRYYYNVNLRKKLVISYLILIIIPVFFLVFFSYTNIRKSAVQNTGAAYLETLKQVEKNISFGLETAYNISNLTQSNFQIQNILRIVSQRDLTSLEVIDFYDILNDNIVNFQGNKNILCVSYFLKGNPAFVSANNNFRSINELKSEKALYSLMQGNTIQGWYNAAEFKNLKLIRNNEILLIRELRDINNIKNVLGYVMIEMNPDFIWKIITDVELPSGAEVLVRKNGMLLSGGNPDKLKLTKLFINSERTEAEGIYKYKDNSTAYYCIDTKVEGINWDISLLMTEKQLGADSRWILNLMLLLSASISFLAIITAFFISGTITKRLKKLVKLIKHAENGDFGIESNIKGNDEYAGLQRSFNKMSLKIKELIEEVYQAKISKQEMEMKLLYAQINPHFLYNTLDIIQWSALRIKADDIAEVTEALAKFLRLSLNGGKENISLSDELEEVGKYMQIINYRYRDAIRVVVDVEPGLEEIQVIKMILQPLIENAIVHGIRPKSGKNGTIILRAHRVNEYLMLEVHDDGVGISRRRIDSLLINESGGYGVKNVHQRIQVYYGQECGLHFYSKPGIGCSVVAKLKTTLQ